MSHNRIAGLVLAAAAALGGGFYFASRDKPTSDIQQRQQRAESTKERGEAGRKNELGNGLGLGNDWDTEKRITAREDQVPPGGVGGGVGAGGNAASDVGGIFPRVPSISKSQRARAGSGWGFSEMFTGMFGTGRESDRPAPDPPDEPKNTRLASHNPSAPSKQERAKTVDPQAG